MFARVVVRVALAVAAVLSFASGASAQVFGTFTWQMQPFCNQVTLTLTSVNGNFTVDGFDDQCGAAKRASAVGMGVFNPDGTVGIDFTIASPDSSTVHVTASVSPANGQGTWTDDDRNSGTFAFFGSTPGLPRRPTSDVHFRVVGLTTLSAPSSSLTNLTTWSASPSENRGGGTWTPATGTFTAPSAGLYLITAVVRWPVFAAAAGHHCIYINTAGTRTAMTCQAPSTTAGFIIQHVSTVISLSANAPVLIQAIQTSGAATNIGPSSTESMFTVTRLR